MSDVVGAFVSHLRTNADAAILVGTRIFRAYVQPDTELPYIVVRQSPGTRREHHQTGVAPIVDVALMVDAYAATSAAAQDLGDKIRLAADSLTNSTIGTVPNRVTVARVNLDEEFPDTIESAAGAGVDQHRWNQNWTLWVDETAPAFA